LAVLRSRLDRSPLEYEAARIAGDGLHRVVVVAEAVEPRAEDFPDEQTAARLERPHVARLPHPLAPTLLARRLVAEQSFRIARQPVIGTWEVVRDVIPAQLVVVQNEVARGLLRLLGVTRDATALEDGLDVAVVLDVFHALLEAQPAFVLHVPLLAGLILLFGG